MSRDPLREEIVRRERLFAGKLLKLERLRVRLPDGSTASREVVRHPGSVALLALSEGRVVLVHQHRAAIGRSLWEVPAGTREPGEDALACARRELIEETGQRAETLVELARFFTAPGFCDEAMILYLARGLRPARAERPADEFLEVGRFTREETERLIDAGKIADAKTLLALALWRTRLG